MTSYRPAMKRALDLALALGSAPLWLPLWGLLALLVRLSIGYPAHFRQDRPGLRGALFKLRKLRTMTMACAEGGFLLSDAARITGIGAILRRASLDEIPTLWNVVKGEMSLVGPRPLLMEYINLYTPEQARRHEVKPGITGWAQVNGRNAITWEEKFEYDIWYVDNWSIWLDLKILWMTLTKVIKMEGINQPGSATMEKFRGSGGKDGGQVQELENAKNQERQTNSIQLDGPAQR